MWPVQVSLDAEDIRNEKVKVLRSMKQVAMSDVVVGQYRGRGSKGAGKRLPGYLDDDTVPAGRCVPRPPLLPLHSDGSLVDGRTHGNEDTNETTTLCLSADVPVSGWAPRGPCCSLSIRGPPSSCRGNTVLFSYVPLCSSTIGGWKPWAARFEALPELFKSRNPGGVVLKEVLV